MSDFTPITTQEELDRIMTDRLDTTRRTRGRYGEELMADDLIRKLRELLGARDEIDIETLIDDALHVKRERSADIALNDDEALARAIGGNTLNGNTL